VFRGTRTTHLSIQTSETILLGLGSHAKRTFFLGILFCRPFCASVLRLGKNSEGDNSYSKDTRTWLGGRDCGDSDGGDDQDNDSQGATDSCARGGSYRQGAANSCARRQAPNSAGGSGNHPGSGSGNVGDARCCGSQDTTSVGDEEDHGGVSGGGDPRVLVGDDDDGDGGSAHARDRTRTWHDSGDGGGGGGGDDVDNSRRDGGDPLDDAMLAPDSGGSSGNVGDARGRASPDTTTAGDEEDRGGVGVGVDLLVLVGDDDGGYSGLPDGLPRTGTPRQTRRQRKSGKHRPR